MDTQRPHNKQIYNNLSAILELINDKAVIDARENWCREWNVEYGRWNIAGSE